MARHVPWIAAAAIVVGCGSDRPAGPPRLGDRADAKALTAALLDAAAAPAATRAAKLAAAVHAACGTACACLASDPATPTCPAANPSVPAGWPALELAGRYLREQLELASAKDRGRLADALAALAVPVPRLDAGVALPVATAARPLSAAPVVLLDAQAVAMVARHPVVTFGATGATVTDPPPAQPVGGRALHEAVDEALAQLAARPGGAPAVDAGVASAAPDPAGGLLGDPNAGGLGLGGIGIGSNGATGWGTIGTGRYGDLGQADRVELWALAADREPLAADQPVIAAPPTLAVEALEGPLGFRGGAIAARSGDRVGELPWTFRAEALLARVAGVSLARTPDGLALANDGTALVRWAVPLTSADRAALEQRVAQLPAAARTRLVVEVYDVSVADAVATLELAASLAPTITLVLRRTIAWGSYSGGLGVDTGPQVRPGQPQTVGDMDPVIIRRYVRRNLPKITYCYERELLSHPALAGTVTAQFFISPNGSVASARATGVSPEVATCVADVLRGIEFPKPRGGGGVQINYPFTFRTAP